MTGQAAPAAPVQGGAPGSTPAPGSPRASNGFATAALALGAAGMTLITIVPALACGLAGLRRAARCRGGRVRSWAGIVLAVLWAGAGACLVPHLARAADPGCTAYKGPALAAYSRVIADLGGHRAGTVTADLARAITALDTAAAHSHDRRTAGDLALLSGQLRAVLRDIRGGTVVPEAAMRALNHDAGRADAACGTLRL
jgi:hypothetical protein